MTEPLGVAYVGRKVLKNFPGHGNFFGTVEKFYGAWKSHPWLVCDLHRDLSKNWRFARYVSLLVHLAGEIPGRR